MPLYPNSSLSQPAAPVAVTLRGPELPSISDIREVDEMRDKITECYMTKSAKIKYMHETYKK